jgi:hypothetical protein
MEFLFNLGFQFTIQQVQITIKAEASALVYRALVTTSKELCRIYFYDGNHCARYRLIQSLEHVPSSLGAALIR